LIKGIMTDWQKYEVYMAYVIIQLKLKHNFNVVDLTKENAFHGWGVPDKVVGDLAFYYSFKHKDPMTFEEFTNTDKHGENIYTFNHRFKIV